MLEQQSQKVVKEIKNNYSKIFIIVYINIIYHVLILSLKSLVYDQKTSK